MKQNTLIGVILGIGTVIALGAAAPMLIDNLKLGGDMDAGGNAITNAGDVVATGGASLTNASEKASAAIALNNLYPPFPTSIIVTNFGSDVNGEYTFVGFVSPSDPSAGMQSPMWTNTVTQSWITKEVMAWYWTINDDTLGTFVYFASDPSNLYDPTAAPAWTPGIGSPPVGQVLSNGTGPSSSLQDLYTYIVNKRVGKNSIDNLGTMASKSAATYSTTNDAVTAISVSGTTTKTITLTRGGGNLSANFTDLNTSYTEITEAALTNSTSSTTGLITGRRAAFLIAQKAHPKIAEGYFTVINTTNLVFIAGSVTNLIDGDITSP